MAIDEKNKGFLIMDFNWKSESNKFMNLNEVQSCKLAVIKENGSDNTNQIDLELHYKESKKTDPVSFDKIENDQMEQVCLYEDHQLAQKMEDSN